MPFVATLKLNVVQLENYNVFDFIAPKEFQTYFALGPNSSLNRTLPLFAAASKDVSKPEVFTESSISTLPNSSADIVPLSDIEPLPSSARSSSSKVD